MKSYSLMLLTLFLFACSSTKNTSITEGRHPYISGVILQAGANHGGIVENTDMEQLKGVPVDAMTGATIPGINIGAHVTVRVSKNYIETGIDMITGHQEFNYTDQVNGNNGVREIRTTQLRLPVLFNFTIGRNYSEIGLLQVKIGYSFGYSLFNVNDLIGILPDYETNPFSGGICLGISAYPWKFKNNSKLGIYMDLMRAGSYPYKDMYSSSDMHGLSYLKFGIGYQLPIY